MFFDEVRVPVENRVGAENDGWRVTNVTLSFERGTAFVSEMVDALRMAEDLAPLVEDQTERRELYVMIAPDASNVDASATPNTKTPSSACMVGQWVTVTRDNGFVPSMSVTWKQVGNLFAAWTGPGGGENASAAVVPDAAVRQTGLTKLQDEFRRQRQPADR